MTETLPWLVEGFLPKGHRILIVAYAGSLKSFFVEYLAICIAAGMKFLGYAVTQGTVILVDEDTPQDELDLHLDRLAMGCGFATYLELPITVHSMDGFTFDNKNKVATLVSEVQNICPQLVIFDCLSAMTGNMHENDAGTANTIASAQKQILHACKLTTIISNHHAKKGSMSGSVEDLNQANLTDMARGSGQLVATCDTAFGMTLLQQQPRTLCAMIPKPRRRALAIKEPFCVELLEEKYGSGWAKLGIVDMPCREPSNEVKDIFPLFRQDALTLNTRQILQITAKRYSERKVREVLDELERNHAIIKAVGTHNRFTYTLNPQYMLDVPRDYWQCLEK